MPRVDELAQLLARFATRDRDQAATRERMLALLDADGRQALTRAHYRPGHFTASAFVLSPTRRELLLILHGKLGMWLQPGGHLEPGDGSMPSAARREVLEEVGLDALELLIDGIFDIDIHDIPARSDAPRHQHFDVRFLFRASHVALLEGDEVRGARWVPLGEVEAFACDDSVRRAAAWLARAQ
jgi:8-oxo-dGTP pyrophosphatase MutT (NUDIX family)